MNVNSKMRAVFGFLKAQSTAGLIILSVLTALLICGFFGTSTVFAQTEADKAIEYNNKSVLKMNKKDFKGALKDLDEAIKLDPDYFLAHDNRITVKELSGDYKGALADYDVLVHLSTTRAAHLRDRRGLAKCNLQDYLGAISDFDEAIRLDPNEAKYYTDRAVAKEKQGDEKGAAEDISHAKQLR